MPELPEVETTRRAIAPLVTGRTVTGVVARQARLRLPLAPELAAQLGGRRVDRLERRGKYLLFRFQAGTLLLHLGMSGSLRVVPAGSPAGRHDHLDIFLDSGQILRLTDPRRFGTVLWTAADPLSHPLLASLGPEPLSRDFTGAYLFGKSRRRSVAIKALLMNSRIVAGVGNIYANEALFRAGILPSTPAGRLARRRCDLLAGAVKEVLAEALEQGEATLAQFVSEAEWPGYFRLQPAVYGREGEGCGRCGSAIRMSRQGGRATYFCERCQR